MKNHHLAQNYAQKYELSSLGKDLYTLEPSTSGTTGRKLCLIDHERRERPPLLDLTHHSSATGCMEG